MVTDNHVEQIIIQPLSCSQNAWGYPVEIWQTPATMEKKLKFSLSKATQMRMSHPGLHHCSSPKSFPDAFL